MEHRQDGARPLGHVLAYAAFALWSALAFVPAFGEAAAVSPPSAVVDVPPPRNVTALTRADPAALARLQAPGEVLFADDFEADDATPNAWAARYFEVRGGAGARVLRVVDPVRAHAGWGALELRAPAAPNGGASGAGISGWLGNAGHTRVHASYWLRFAPDYDTGRFNHTGVALAGVAGTNKWGGMGGAGKRPNGNDYFTVAYEHWREGPSFPSPGFPHAYVYWQDMRPDGGGHYWGNSFRADRRTPTPLGRWVQQELMVQTNTPGSADGELALWTDGVLELHLTGVRWRTAPEVLLKRFGIDIYVHNAVRDNTVWIDDVVISTGFVGVPAADTAVDAPADDSATHAAPDDAGTVDAAPEATPPEQP